MVSTKYMQFLVKWQDGGRRPENPPDPNHPDGVDIVIPGGPKDSLNICAAKIPYPPPHVNVGQWMVQCRRCGFRVAVTAASRPDDPKSISFPCQKQRMKSTKGSTIQ